MFLLEEGSPNRENKANGEKKTESGTGLVCLQAKQVEPARARKDASLEPSEELRPANTLILDF